MDRNKIGRNMRDTQHIIKAKICSGSWNKIWPNMRNMQTCTIANRYFFRSMIAIDSHHLSWWSVVSSLELTCAYYLAGTHKHLFLDICPLDGVLLLTAAHYSATLQLCLQVLYYAVFQVLPTPRHQRSLIFYLSLSKIFFSASFIWVVATSLCVVTNIMASSHSNGSAPSFLISNISNLVSIKLDRHNYLLWRSQFESLLLSHDLMGFVDGSNPCPEKFARDNEKKLTSTISPAFLE